MLTGQRERMTERESVTGAVGALIVPGKISFIFIKMKKNITKMYFDGTLRVNRY